MTAGIQLFDSSGSVLFDGTERLVRFMGWGSFGLVDGSVSDARFSDGEMVVVLTPIDDETLTRPVFSYTSTSFSWTYDSTPAYQRADGTFFYGVF